MVLIVSGLWMQVQVLLYLNRLCTTSKYTFLLFQTDHPDLLPFGIVNGDQLISNPPFYAPVNAPLPLPAIFFGNEEKLLYVSL